MGDKGSFRCNDLCPVLVCLEGGNFTGKLVGDALAVRSITSAGVDVPGYSCFFRKPEILNDETFDAPEFHILYLSMYVFSLVCSSKSFQYFTLPRLFHMEWMEWGVDSMEWGWTPWNGGWIPWNGGWIPYFFHGMVDGFHGLSRWIPYLFHGMRDGLHTF